MPPESKPMAKPCLVQSPLGERSTRTETAPEAALARGALPLGPEDRGVTAAGCDLKGHFPLPGLGFCFCKIREWVLDTIRVP